MSEALDLAGDLAPGGKPVERTGAGEPAHGQPGEQPGHDGARDEG